MFKKIDVYEHLVVLLVTVYVERRIYINSLYKLILNFALKLYIICKNNPTTVALILSLIGYCYVSLYNNARWYWYMTYCSTLGLWSLPRCDKIYNCMSFKMQVWLPSNVSLYLSLCSIQRDLHCCGELGMLVSASFDGSVKFWRKVET